MNAAKPSTTYRREIRGEYWRIAVAAAVILLSVTAAAMLALAADGRAGAPPPAVTAAADPCQTASIPSDCRRAQAAPR